MRPSGSAAQGRPGGPAPTNAFSFQGRDAPEPLNPQGLRRGFTTGSAAAAALAAALALLERGERRRRVTVRLPDEVALTVQVQAVRVLEGGSAYAEVVKDGGDDPDATHGATLWVSVSRLPTGAAMTFHAGAGVGTVTRPGLRLPVGEPAINPVPRQMLRWAALDVAGHEAYAVTVGCLGGEAIVRKTFNPRLGVVGGISILGTSGVVEPMSLEAYAASVEVYVRFAAAGRPQLMALTPGKLGRDYAERLGLPRAEIVQMSNFVGAALDALQSALQADSFELPHLLVAGHPAKLAKVLNGDWNTHSAHSGMAMNALARVAAQLGLAEPLVQALAEANTVDACVDVLAPHPDGPGLWQETARQIAGLFAERVPSVRRLEVALFALDGRALSSFTHLKEPL